MFWRVMKQYQSHFLLWDAFPLHSHQPGNIDKNRNPTKKEIQEFAEALNLIIAYISPKFIIAVGKKAFDGLKLMGHGSECVRHPANGGNKEFAKNMKDILAAHNF